MVVGRYSLILTLFLSGCGTTVHEIDEIIPPSEISMKEIFDNKGVVDGSTELTLNNVKSVVRRPTSENEILASIYDANGIRENPRFQKLPNPTLYIYFPASLTKDRMPLPAWMTEFHMFDRDEYALPGELGFGERH